MKILNQNPPNLDVIVAALGPRDDQTVYCYAPNIYNPNGVEIEADILAHEKVHLKQQGNDPDSWWYRFLRDKDFRLEQEVEAYAVQYNHVRMWASNSITQEALTDFAMSLSGACYDLDISYQDAELLIRRKAKS